MEKSNAHVGIYRENVEKILPSMIVHKYIYKYIIEIMYIHTLLQVQFYCSSLEFVHNS